MTTITEEMIGMKMCNSSTSEFIADYTFRHDLKIARKKAHISQEEVSKRTGLSISAISRIENSEADVLHSSILKYVDALGLQINLGPKPEYMMDNIGGNSNEADS
jgi:transcriptional regulator with XRE-family HTH domain